MEHEKRASLRRGNSLKMGESLKNRASFKRRESLRRRDSLTLRRASFYSHELTNATEEVRTLLVQVSMYRIL